MKQFYLYDFIIIKYQFQLAKNIYYYFLNFLIYTYKL